VKASNLAFWLSPSCFVKEPEVAMPRRQPVNQRLQICLTLSLNNERGHRNKNSFLYQALKMVISAVKLDILTWRVYVSRLASVVSLKWPFEELQSEALWRWLHLSPL